MHASSGGESYIGISGYSMRASLAEMMNKMVVIIISDDAQFIYLMQSYIRKSGGRMQAISQNRSDLLKFIQRVKPALIFWDADSRESATLNILATIKSNGVVRKIPMVICSWGKNETADFEEGHDFRLNKPVIYSDFQKTLAQIEIVQNNSKEALI